MHLLIKHPLAVLLSLLVHAVLFFLLFNASHLTKPVINTQQANVNTIKAKAVDSALLKQELAKLRQHDQSQARKKLDTEKKLRAEEQRLKKLKKARKNAEKKRKKEEKKLRETQKKRKLAEKKRKKAEKKRKRAEKKRKLAEKKRKKAEKARRAAEVKAKKAEEKRKLEEKKRKKAEKVRKKKEAERRRLEQRKKRMEAELAEELAAEKKNDANSKKNKIVTRYIGIIREKVESIWVRPASARAGMSCTLKVKLMPGGDVVSVKVVKSSGDHLFDESVKSAVYKAAPLPLPADNRLFVEFKELNIVFKPS